MKKDIRIIAPDLRGHGSSIIEESNYSIADMASDVIELLDHLQLGQVGIAGHSLGGYIALEIARIFPERISGLVLIASHIYADSLEKKQSRFNTADQIKTRGVQEILTDMPKKLTHNENIRIICQDAVAKMDSNGAIGALHAMANRGSSELVWETLAVPTLVIAGSDDQIIPIEKSRKIAGMPKHNAFEEIVGAGHMPMLETPKFVAKALIKFINKSRRLQ